MADGYLLENGLDRYLIEDGLGVYLLEQQGLTVSPSAIGSAEAFGTPIERLILLGTGLASAEAFGVAVERLSLAPNAIGTLEAFGAVTLVTGATISPGGIASAEAFGTAKTIAVLFPSAISPAEAFGAVVERLGLSPSGIGTAEAFGAPRQRMRIVPVGVASGETFGTTGLVLRLAAVAIGSAEVFGDLSRPAQHIIGQAVEEGPVTEQDKLDIADRVLDELLSGHTTAGSLGKAIADVNTRVASLPKPRGVRAQAFGLSFMMLTTDGLPATGLSVSVMISKNGGAAVATTNAPADVGLGLYYLSLTATEMTADMIGLRFTASGARPQALSIATYEPITA